MTFLPHGTFVVFDPALGADRPATLAERLEQMALAQVAGEPPAQPDTARKRIAEERAARDRKAAARKRIAEERAVQDRHDRAQWHAQTAAHQERMRTDAEYRALCSNPLKALGLV